MLVALAPTSSTRLALLPLIVTPAAGPVMVVAPVVSVSVNCVPPRVMVWDVLNTVESKVMASAPVSELAKLTAWRRLRIPAGAANASLVLLTTSGLPVSNAPISTAPTRGNPRWSVAGAPVLVPALIAGLFDRSAIVCVGPPFHASAPSCAAGPTRSLLIQPPLQFTLVIRLLPRDVPGPNISEPLPEVFPLKIVLVSVKGQFCVKLTLAVLIPPP